MVIGYISRCECTGGDSVSKYHLPKKQHRSFLAQDREIVTPPCFPTFPDITLCVGLIVGLLSRMRRLSSGADCFML